MVFKATLECMAFLFSLIVIGYILVKCKALPEEASIPLSKLENFLFIPALVMGAFMNNFTTQTLGKMGIAFLAGVAFLLISIPIAIIFSKILTKDASIRKIYTYSLSISNFGFMGNAVVSAVFPEYFAEYVMFTLPLWIGINVWGAPILLTERKEGEKFGVKQLIKSLINPLTISMVVGMALGLSGLKFPSFFNKLVTDLGNCMSPIAMLLTGMTVAKVSLAGIFKDLRIYLVSAIKLLLFPALALLVIFVFKIPSTLAVLIASASAMPLGLNIVVIPRAQGRDVSFSSGLILVSHILSVLTIPLVYTVLQMII